MTMLLHLTVLAAFLPTPGAAPTEVRVTGLGVALGPTPVLAEIDANSELKPGSYSLRAEGSNPLECEVYETNGKRWLAFVLDEIAAGQTRTFHVESVDHEKSAAGPGIRAEITAEGALEIKANGKAFTTLNQQPRKPYFYPVFGPGQRAFTRAYPMRDVEGEKHDHPHQRSLWFTHGDVNGFDFWGADPLNGANPRFGSIRQAGPPVIVAMGAVGVVRTRNRWLDPKGGSVCEDEREFRLWDLGNARVIDAVIRVHATDGPVKFGDTKEGTFGLRVPSSIDVNRGEGGTIVNAEGLKDQNAWGKRSPWVDYSGPIEGQTGGIAILNHPSSFRFPTPWHVRDYGLFAANPFGNRDFGISEPGAYVLPKGETLTFAYRVILHQGSASDAQIPAQFAAYSQPPMVEVVAETNP